MTQRFDSPERLEMTAACADVEAQADRALTSIRRVGEMIVRPATERFKAMKTTINQLCRRPRMLEGSLSPCANCLVNDVCDAVMRRARLALHTSNHGLFAETRVRYKDSFIDRLEGLGVKSDRVAGIKNARGIITGRATHHDGHEYVEVRWEGASSTPHWSCADWIQKD